MEEQERSQEAIKTEEDTHTRIKGKSKIMDRLLQSVNMVKDVLQTNLKLRQQVLAMSKEIDKANLGFAHVQEVNEELKEKMQTLTNSAQENDFSGTHASMASTFSGCVGRESRLAAAGEVYQLRREVAALEQRLKGITRANFTIKSSTIKGYPQFTSGVDDYEPVRSVVSIEETKPYSIENLSEEVPFEMVKTMYKNRHASNEPSKV